MIKIKVNLNVYYTRPSKPISAVKLTSAVKTFAVMFPQTFAVMFRQTFAAMFHQTFAVILTGRVNGLNVCAVFKSFRRGTCGPPYKKVLWCEI